MKCCYFVLGFVLLTLIVGSPWTRSLSLSFRGWGGGQSDSTVLLAEHHIV